MMELSKGIRPIMMKSGLFHWVEIETWEKASEIIANQTGHQFIRIKELNITINTANIEEVCTSKEFEDYKMVKQGMWQCEYREWHTKGKRNCFCKEETAKKMRQAMINNERDTKPLTEEERVRSREMMKENKEILILRGVFNGDVRKKTHDKFIKKNPSETINPKAIIV